MHKKVTFCKPNDGQVFEELQRDRPIISPAILYKRPANPDNKALSGGSPAPKPDSFLHKTRTVSCDPDHQAIP
ncbi:hypothetical protein [Thermoleptolyngbya sp. PKUAC-SCTB121]|uniref:hypothetical protein n=1 Tax=Thermoleptolyngbya sp. PKUAC-SCTB121 TaxID=2811482 RepID=UPI001963BFC6|nr:hypothetical protein [Thermoleptolyngbya sp. PKUAC-SCTB121]